MEPIEKNTPWASPEPGQDARDDQRFIARRQPGDEVADGEQGHQAEQQLLARQLAGQGGQQRRTDGDAECVETHQQAGRGQADAEVGGDGRDQADDDELGRPDGEGADRQGEQGKRHGGIRSRKRTGASLYGLHLPKKPSISEKLLRSDQI